MSKKQANGAKSLPPAAPMEGSDAHLYVAFFGDTYLAADANLDRLIAELTGTWILRPGEDVAIWHADKTVAAVLKGRKRGPRVVKFRPEEAPGKARADTFQSDVA